MPNCQRAIPSESIRGSFRRGRAESKIQVSVTPSHHSVQGPKSQDQCEPYHRMTQDLGVFYATGEFPLCGAVGMAR